MLLRFQGFHTILRQKRLKVCFLKSTRWEKLPTVQGGIFAGWCGHKKFEKKNPTIFVNPYKRRQVQGSTEVALDFLTVLHFDGQGPKKLS